MVFMPPLLEKQNKKLVITNLILFSSGFLIEPLGLLSSGKYGSSYHPVWSVVKGVDSSLDLKFYEVQNLHK